MSEGETYDVWDQAGEHALRNLTAAVPANDDDFDDFDISEQNTSKNFECKPFKDKDDFEPCGTLNVLSPCTLRKTDDPFVKTLNRPVHEKVINLDHQLSYQNNFSNQDINKQIPDKIPGLNDISRESSVTNDLNGLCTPTANLNIQVSISDHESVTGHNPASEWEGLERQLNFGGENGAQNDEPMMLSTPLFGYQDAVAHFKGIDLSIYEPDILTSIRLTGLSRFLAHLCGPPRLRSELKVEKTFVFCLARCQFDNEDPKDFQILMTIYKCLTGTTLDCSRHGSHWQDIGFQGNDPATDLRGTGMLSLLTILYLVRDQKSLAHKLYQLSQHETQNFPFCVVLINLTKIVLVALRSSYLNKECNRRYAILPVVCDAFAALTFEYYKLWKTGMTIKDSGFVLKNLEDKTKSSSQCIELIANFKKYCSENEVQVVKEDGVFLDVCKSDSCRAPNDNDKPSRAGRVFSKYVAS